MGTNKISVKFNQKVLKEAIERKTSINKASIIAGYAQAPTFRAALRKGEMPIHRLLKLIEYYDIDIDELVENAGDLDDPFLQRLNMPIRSELFPNGLELYTDASDLLFINQMIDKGLMSIEDKREWAEMEYKDHDLITLLKDFGYVIEPMKDGHTDYSGKEITNSISNADTFALFNRIYEFIETELKQFDHQQFLNWAKEGTNISFSSDEYEIIHKDEHGVVVRKRHGKQEK